MIDQVPKAFGGGKRARVAVQDMKVKDSDHPIIKTCFNMKSFDAATLLKDLSKEIVISNKLIK